jgi:hypothetical protein
MGLPERERDRWIKLGGGDGKRARESENDRERKREREGQCVEPHGPHTSSLSLSNTLDKRTQTINAHTRAGILKQKTCACTHTQTHIHTHTHTHTRYIIDLLDPGSENFTDVCVFRTKPQPTGGTCVC